MAEPTASYTDNELDEISKKDLVTYLQKWCTMQFQQEHKLKGQVKNIAKKSKDLLIADYKAMWETKAFKAEGEDAAAAAASAAATVAAEAKAVDDVTKKARNLSLSEDKEDAPKKYRKIITKKGDKLNFPNKGDYVHVYYKGMLADGTVFDQNLTGGKRGNRKPQPFKFRVGKGLVIRGWDEALLTMCIGEHAEVIIEPEWAYGRTGNQEGKIPGNATLKFEMELVSIDQK